MANPRPKHSTNTAIIINAATTDTGVTPPTGNTITTIKTTPSCNITTTPTNITSTKVPTTNPSHNTNAGSGSGSGSVPASGSISSGPFDISSNLGMGFGIYRPRRASYTLATQRSRRRNASYRCATREEHLDSNSESINGEELADDNNGGRHKRKISYLKATDSGHSALSKLSSRDIVAGGSSYSMSDNRAVSFRVGDRKSYAGASDVRGCDSSRGDYSRREGRRTEEDEEERGTHFEFKNNLNHECDRELVTVTIKSLSSNNGAKTNGSVPHCRPPLKASEERGGESLRASFSNSWKFNKNLVILCICFILVFSSFQAIQNLQSSLNAAGDLGTISMTLVHIAMIFSCLVAPIIINVCTAKWALCGGVACFLLWFGANFYPRYYTLVPTSILVGFGQGVLWGAESSYLHKLAHDSARVSGAKADSEMYRFHGIFLACFQTTHIWGNLISSLWLSQRWGEVAEKIAEEKYALVLAGITTPFPMPPPKKPTCGALHRCAGDPLVPYPLAQDVVDNEALPLGFLWKLMSSYVLFGLVTFALILFALDRIGARAGPDKSPLQIIIQHTGQLVSHRTLRLLIPLLLFNGMQQGFMYADYNYYFVTCTLGVQYVGYCMITLGVSNVLGAIFMAFFSHRIPREVSLGFGGILHVALMIGYLIWIPEGKPALFYVLAAAWGVCDAVWQTQCNTLICLTCTEEPDVAFTNYRLVHALGLALAFAMGSWVCVSVKLYLLMTLLVVAIMFYVLAEYQLRHDDDDVFDEP